MSLTYKKKNGQYILEKDGFTPKMTLWSKVKWNLFGETKIFFWWIGGIVLLNVLFWGGIVFVIAHFLHKYW
jgi:hypothetical protein